MKKRELVNKNVISAMSVGIAAMLAMSTPMTVLASEGSGDPYASQVVDKVDDNNEIDTFKVDYLFDVFDYDSNKAVDSSKAEFHNNEADRVEEASESVKAMEETAQAAQDAADEATEAVDDLKDALEKLGTPEVEATETEEAKEATGAVKDASDAAGDAEEAAGSAEDAASGAKEHVSDAKDDKDEIVRDAKAYNDKVDKDQDAIDNYNIQRTTIKDKVEEKAEETKNHLEEAKKELAAALDIESDVMTDEILEHVNKAIEEADKADAAATSARDTYKDAQNQCNKAIKQYNLYAYAYGLPLYDGTTDYTDEDVAKALGLKDGETSQAAKEAALEALISGFDAAHDGLSDFKGDIDLAKTDVAAARAAYDQAKKDAHDAQEAAAEAASLIENKVAEAEENATATTDYYVAPAQSAYDKTVKEDIPAAEQKKTEAKDALDAATVTAQRNADNDYNDELDRLEGVMNAAKKKYDDSKVFGIGNPVFWIQYISAQNDYDDYKNDENKIKAGMVADAVKEQKKAYDDAVADRAALDTKASEQKAVLDEAIDTRDAYLLEAGKKATDEFTEKMTQALQDCSDVENQLDYEQALNDWANNELTWNFISQGVIRSELNDRYVDSFWEKLGNTLGLTQFVVPTDSADAKIDGMRTKVDGIIEDYLEELSMAQANWANESAKLAGETKDDIYDSDTVQSIVDGVDAYEQTVQDAEAAIDQAELVYNQAEIDLAGIKNEVSALELKGIDLSSFKQKIAEAEARVASAEKAYNEALAAKENASNLKKLAVKLQSYSDDKKTITTETYAQITKDEDGNTVYAEANKLDYDLTDGKVVSRDTAKFSGNLGTVEIPYSMYRDYVKYVSENLNYKETVGNGIAINENSHPEEMYFWELNEDGTALTGKRYTADELAKENPESGAQYLLGYTFKIANATTYHIDGYVYTYEHILEEELVTPDVPDVPVIPDVPVTPDTPATPDAPAAPVLPYAGITPVAPVIFTETPEAFAAAPVATPAPEVLGVSRAAEENEEQDGAVLGARRTNSGSVLGARREAKTGDASNALPYVGAMVGATAAAGVYVTMRRKKED